VAVAGVVVGVNRTASGPALRWASAEAAVRRLPLTLVHAWDEPVDLSVDLPPESLPDVHAPATSCAVHGRAAAVLLTARSDLLVLGVHSGAHRLSRLTRSCLHRAPCPVVAVPDSEGRATGRVVVGVCGTDASRRALRWAADAAALRGADLVVVYAWQLHPASARDVLRPTRALPAQREAALERVRAWVHAVLGVTDVEVHAHHGGPLDALLEHSDDADLIVLGRNSHAGRAKVLHGAVIDDLTGLAPCPVAVIPGPA
jgi:nucleotide-binding universal stress UspA family protein